MKKQLNKNYFKAFIAFCTLCIYWWTPLAHAMYVGLELALEVIQAVAQAGLAIISLVAAMQHNVHMQNMPSVLQQEMRKDPILQQVMQHQAKIVTHAPVTLSSHDTAKAMRNFAAVQKDLVQAIPEVVAQAVELVRAVDAASSPVLNNVLEQKHIVAAKINMATITKKIIARHEAFMREQFNEAAQWCVLSLVPGGVRIDSKDSNWYMEATVLPRIDRTPYGVQLRDQQRAYKQLFDIAMHHPTYETYIKNAVCHVEHLLHLANSDDIASRLYARMALSQMKLLGPVYNIDGQMMHIPVPFEYAFEKMLEETGKRWYSKDGQLVATEKMPELHALSEDFINQATQHIPDLGRSLKHVATIDDIKKEGFLRGWLNGLIRWFSASHHSRVDANEANKVVKKCIIACLDLNMDDANTALKQYAEGMQRSKFSREMYESLVMMVNDANAKNVIEQKRICNEHGVYRAFTQDPIYAQLDEQSLRSIAQDKVDLSALNHVLLVRNQIKESMKRAWHIRCEPGSAVDQALYALLDYEDISDPQVLAYAINEVVESQDPAVRQEVVDALYMPNGVIKDFARWKKARSVVFSDTILKPEYDAARHELNQLLCLEKEKLSAHQTICLKHAMTYLEHALKTDDAELKSAYLSLYDNLANAVHEDTPSLLTSIPCLVGTFDQPAANLTQKTIALIGASLAEVEQQILHSALLDVDSQERVAQEFAKQLDVLRKAHELNAQDWTTNADCLLTETFKRPTDGFFIWPSYRPLIYAHHAVESVRACINEDATNVEVECGTSILTKVLSRGELHIEDIEKKLDGIAAIQSAYSGGKKSHQKGKSNTDNAVRSGGGGSPNIDPEDPENKGSKDKKKHPHGKYEDAGYHHPKSKGMKSPAPKDGQGALDNSMPIEGKAGRISLHNGEFVVLNQTSRGVYHGHVRPWKALTEGMQKALKIAKLVSDSGKILR